MSTYGNDRHEGDNNWNNYTLPFIKEQKEIVKLFRDNIDYASRYNISNIIQPGGSIQDSNIIEACNTYNITMAITDKRFFLH